MKTNNLLERMHKAEQEAEYQKKRSNEWQKRFYELTIELQKTQALLNQFLNANTPSSKLPFKYPSKKSNEEPKPRGKPLGSNGATKEAPDKIDKKVKAKLGKNCSWCGKKINQTEIAKQTRYVYDIIINPIITEVEEEFYYCNCGGCCLGKHPEIPERGMIGYNLQSLFTELKHNFSGSYGKISEFTKNVSGISFTSQAIHDCLKRIGETLEQSYDNMETKLKNTEYAYSDETGWPVNGIKWWLWLFVTQNFTFITVKNSRSRRVLTDIFGEEYHGVIISDCFKAYGKFARWFQKCWIHFLRKVEFEAEKYPRKNIKKLHEQLLILYQEMVKFLEGDPPPEIRMKMKKVFEKKLLMIKNYKDWCDEAKVIIKNWLVAYEGHWLTAIEIEGISLDNNVSERGIRKSIGWRKMLGGHRTREGVKIYSIIETHRQTWKLQNKSPYNELISFLKQPVECIV